MKRWLIVMSLLVAGLLMVGWGGDALAARHSPSLLQKILAMFTPQQVPGNGTGATAGRVDAACRDRTGRLCPAGGREGRTGPGSPRGRARARSYDQRKEGRSPQADTTSFKRATRSRRQGLFRQKPAAEKTWALASLPSSGTGSSHQACAIQTGTILTTAEAGSGKARDREGAAGSGGHSPNPCDQEGQAGQGTTRRNRAIGAGDTAGKGRHPGGTEPEGSAARRDDCTA